MSYCIVTGKTPTDPLLKVWVWIPFAIASIDEEPDSTDETKHSTDETKHSTDETKHSADETKHSADETKHSTDETKHSTEDPKHTAGATKENCGLGPIPPRIEVPLLSTHTRQAEIWMSNDTLPPLPPDNPSANTTRFNLHPLSFTDRTIFGIYSQWHGRRMWLYLKPTDPNPLRWVERADGTPPPATNHPAIWKVQGSGFGDTRTVYNVLYSKYVVASTTTEQLLASSTYTQMCNFKFIWRTNSGPPISTPDHLSTEEPAQYLFLSNYNKALTYSLTAPYLTQQTLDYNNINQRFYMRAVERPNAIQQNLPFSYHLFMVANPDTMFCIEDNLSIGIRTAGGQWEELTLAGSEPEFSSEFFPAFKIESTAFGSTMRSKPDNSVIGNPASNGYNWEDYYTMITFKDGIPFMERGAEKCEKEKHNKCCMIA